MENNRIFASIIDVGIILIEDKTNTGKRFFQNSDLIAEHSIIFILYN